MVQHVHQGNSTGVAAVHTFVLASVYIYTMSGKKRIINSNKRNKSGTVY